MASSLGVCTVIRAPGRSGSSSVAVSNLSAAGFGTLLFTVLGPAPAPTDWPLADGTVFLVEAALFAATAVAAHRLVATKRGPQT